MTQFHPPAGWPDARTEKALDDLCDEHDAIARRISTARTRCTEAGALVREALAAADLATRLLRRACTAETEERLTIWRAAGYEL